MPTKTETIKALKLKHQCHSCRGTGRIKLRKHEDSYVKCPICVGKGHVAQGADDAIIRRLES